MKLFLWFIFVFTSFGVASQQTLPIWQQQEATDGSNVDCTPLVIVDSFHNIITCGTIYAAGPALGFVTFKYNQNGQKLWERRHQTSATDFITAAATDATGAVYVGGVTINDIFGGAGNQIIFKYSTDGDTLWQYYLKVEEGVTSSIRNLLLDEAQNLLIFGSYFDTLQDRGGLFVQKKAPDGTLLWTATHVEGDYGYGASNAIRVGDRWVFWGRNSSSSAGGTRLLCWQIDVNGQTIQTAASELNPEIIYPLHIDRVGNLYLTRGNEYKVIKYSTSAQKQWEYLNPAELFPQFTVAARLGTITSDEDLNIYTSGIIRIDSLHVDPITTKLSQEGEVVWASHLSVFGPEAQDIFPEQSIWLPQKQLLVAGIMITNPDSNLYEPTFAIYSTSGLIKASYSDIAGRRNDTHSIASDNSCFYLTGISFAEDGPGVSKQYLCKYSLEDFVSTLNPRESITAQPMSVIPNPVKGRCNLQFDHTGASREGVLQISNAQGVVVFSQGQPLVLGSQSITVTSFAHLPAGVYQVSILTSDRIYSAKVVQAP